jgi:hypothetical protein
MQITKSYSLEMILFLFLSLMSWELGIQFSKMYMLKENLVFDIRRTAVRTICIISVIAGIVLIINAMKNGMPLFSMNAFKSIDILRHSTIAGVTTFTEFVYPGLLGYYYIYNKDKKKICFFDKIIIALNILLILYRTMYMARTNVLYIIIIISLLIISNTKIKITITKILVVGLAFIVFYIFFEYFRTFQVAHEAREYSELEWGYLRLLQYLGSTCHYFLNLAQLKFTPPYTQYIFDFIYDFFDLPKNFNVLYASKYGVTGMTTMSVFGEIYMSAKFLGIFYIFFLGFISNKLYMSFIRERIIGKLFYPLVYVGLCFMFYVNRLTSGINIVHYLGGIIIILFSRKYRKA